MTKNLYIDIVGIIEKILKMVFVCRENKKNVHHLIWRRFVYNRLLSAANYAFSICYLRSPKMRSFSTLYICYHLEDHNNAKYKL